MKQQDQKGTFKKVPSKLTIYDLKIDVTNVYCDLCKADGKETEVKAEAAFSGLYTSEGNKRYIDNNIYTYWSCPMHGSVSTVIINGKLFFGKPEELFKEITLSSKINFISKQFLSEKIQVFRKNLTKTLTELQVEYKEVRKRFDNTIGYDNYEVMNSDRNRVYEIPKEILIIEGKIRMLNELEKDLGG